jgi:hypothetical protein
MVWPFVLPAAWAWVMVSFKVLLLRLSLPQSIGDKHHLKQFIISQDSDLNDLWQFANCACAIIPQGVNDIEMGQG